VPAALRDKVFLRFWRTDRSRSGAGLGLAIVQRTMEAHGGRISIDDAVEGGARFTLYFPPPIPSGAGPAPAPIASEGRRRWYRRPSIAPLASHESGGSAS
jgi:hypothetical protein